MDRVMIPAQWRENSHAEQLGRRVSAQAKVAWQAQRERRYEDQQH